MLKDMGKSLFDTPEPDLIGEPIVDHRIEADSNSSLQAVWLAAGCGGHLMQGTTHTVSSLADPGRLKWMRRSKSWKICTMPSP